ncbi:MAG: hypothetical protein WAL50_21125 [Kineosporiaceae bacterium]
MLITAVTLLIGSVSAVPWIARWTSPGTGVDLVGRPAASPGPDTSARGMRGGGMMGNGNVGGSMGARVWSAGNGVPVTSIDAARARAAQAAASAGLHPGEVIQFSNGFYVELKDTADAAVTEVLIDPISGAVSTEPGPAMMWNTGSRTASVSLDQARTIATQWLGTRRGGETVQSIDAYPGYYTLDTAAGGTLVGMMSVNAATGSVWYHTWHGAFVAREDS